MIFSKFEDAVRALIHPLLSLKQRANNALDGIEKTFGEGERAKVLDLLTKAHQQARQAILAGPDAVRGDVPWEFAHGLSLLGLLDHSQELPKTPEEFATVVLKDGSLLGCRQWELLDPRWSEALVKWLEYMNDHAPFATTPGLVTIPNNVMLAIAGDWGTGTTTPNFPATKVAAQIRKINPDYTIHLGDVYYAGTGEEEGNNMQNWPQGTSGSFTLNSNHEMYDGGYGYFAELARRFPLQKGTSYFALQNDHWLIVGLDSAYYSDVFDLYMKGSLDRTQLSWLAGLPKNKKIIVLSHHEAYDELADARTPLYTQVTQALGRVPDYWYWGHLHNAICYQANGGFHGRCIGHGAIPYGTATELENDPSVLWYEKELANDPDYPERVLNGFARVTLNGDVLDEQMIGEDGSVRWPN